MFWTLFLKECKQMLKCLTYYIIVICMFLMYSTQLGSEKVITKPEPGQKDYGYTYSDDESVIMNHTIMCLAREYTDNKYGTYPIVFYKEVTLGKAKQIKMGEILSEVAGMDKEELTAFLKDYFAVTYIVKSSKETDSSDGVLGKTAVMGGQSNDKKDLVIKAVQGLTYEHFTQLMTKADKLLGGGSSYAKDKLKNNAYVPMTYEQALKEYNNVTEKDHLTGAYARYFCDYFGIVLAILPIFIAVTRVLRDRRARASEIIYSRKASSVHIVISRYLAMIVMLMLPVIILSILFASGCISEGIKAGITVDYIAFPEYIIGWLLPTIMITTSVGVFLTELTDRAIAIIVQGLWWFVSLLSGKLTGNCGWNLIPRHNSTVYYDIFREYYGQFVLNRIVYTIAAILVLIAAVYVYEMKRKGRFSLRGKIFSNRKIKSEA